MRIKHFSFILHLASSLVIGRGFATTSHATAFTAQEVTQEKGSCSPPSTPVTMLTVCCILPLHDQIWHIQKHSGPFWVCSWAHLHSFYWQMCTVWTFLSFLIPHTCSVSGHYFFFWPLAWQISSFMPSSNYYLFIYFSDTHQLHILTFHLEDFLSLPNRSLLYTGLLFQMENSRSSKENIGLYRTICRTLGARARILSVKKMDTRSDQNISRQLQI